MPRVEPISPPYTGKSAALLERMMPGGAAPILLFRTFVKNTPMTEALTGWGGYELSNELSLSLREREIAIDRTCARCSCEYEWGVHVAFFAESAELSVDQVASLTHGQPVDPCWSDERDQLVIAAADSLHDANGFDDVLYAQLESNFTEAELLDLTMLCGWYHAISYTANALQVDLEPGAPRFADYLPDEERSPRV